MRNRSLASSLSLVIVIPTLLATSSAAAQRTGFAVDRFEPAERGSQWFVNDGLDVHRDRSPAFGAVLDYGHEPLVVYNPDGSERAAIVRHQLFADLGASIVLLDRLRLAVNLPVALYQDGEAAVVDTGTGPEAFKPATKPAIGDVRLAADYRLLGDAGDVFVLAAGVRGWLPTGQRSQFTSDGSARIAPQALVSGDVGLFTYAARLALVYRARDDVYAGSALGSELDGAAAAGLKVLDGKLVVGPEVFASSVFTSSSAFLKTRGTPAEWLLGAHYDAGPIRLGAGAGSGLTRGYGAPDVRGLFSVEYVPERKPAPPPVVPPPPEPPPPPPEPPPPPAPPPDKDGDGIPDATDACPDVPGVADPDPKKNGCPPDTDGDGIVNPEDACPKVAGPRNPDPKKNGCPIVVVTEKAIQINEQVKFKFDSAELLPESDVVLGAVKAVLDEHKELTLIRVEGHTDNVGKADYNRKLSQRRAESVMTWLTKRGIDKKRLKAQGFGPDEPVDTNDTDAGRANNRRVAFTILKREDGAKP